MANNTLPLALLIDAENVSCNLIDRIMHETDKLGDPIIRRVYGDFTKQNMTCWHNIIERHAFTVAHLFPYKKGKNSTDIELIMDAMTFQYTTPIKGLIIVSGDSDYCGLAKRYREQNLPVYIIGSEKTSMALRSCCTQFIQISNEANNNTQAMPRPETRTPLYRVQAPSLPGLNIKGKINLEPQSFIEKVLAVLTTCNATQKRVSKTEFLYAFQRKHPNTSINEQGYKTWNAFFTANTGLFTLEQINNEYFIVF